MSAQDAERAQARAERKALREQAYTLATSWDEFGQAFDASGKCVSCVCGLPFPGDEHCCPYDNPPAAEKLAG